MQFNVQVINELVQMPSHKKLFAGFIFTQSGMLQFPRDILKALIERHSGQFMTNVTNKITHVLTTAVDCKESTARMKQAVKKNLPLLSEDYIYDCIKAQRRLNMNKYLFYVGVSFSLICFRLNMFLNL